MKRFISISLERHLIDIQTKIASSVIIADLFSEDLIAGVDQAFMGDMVISGAVTLDFPMKIHELASCTLATSFPYIPGFLSFREGPAAVRAIKALRKRPTLLFVDGCGINHPRHAGLASYIGVVLDIPTVGISKNVLCGSFETPEEVGGVSLLVMDGDKVGYVLKSRKNCRPIVVAPGHLVSVESSLKLVCRFLRNHKLPEPCRLAHDYVRNVKEALRAPNQGGFS
ncbi:MAG: endonuclease V [Methanotrichaceae archaeon]|nr:endonuclease V [Methanotrichaceae archaeon]